MMGLRHLQIAILGLAVVIPNWVDAREFRSINRIKTPVINQIDVPEGAIVSQTPKPVPRRIVEREVESIISKWNTKDMDETLAKEFYDRTRLLDTVEIEIPRDARLRIMAIKSSRTLLEYRIAGKNGLADQVVSHVSAVVDTQLEFSDRDGYQRLPGSNEYLIKVMRKRKSGDDK